MYSLAQYGGVGVVITGSGVYGTGSCSPQVRLTGADVFSLDGNRW